MDVLELLKEVGTPIATSTVASLVTWILTKRKYNTEVDNSVIKNMQDSLDFYKQMVDDNKVRLQEREEENRILREELKSTKEEVRQLREQVDYLMRFVCTNMQCDNRDKKTKNKSKESVIEKKINNK